VITLNASDHVEQLWQLIDPALPDHSPDSRCPIVVGRRPTRLAIFLRISPHTAELGHLEDTPALPNTLLTIKNWTTILQQNQQRGNQHDGQCQ